MDIGTFLEEFAGILEIDVASIGVDTKLESLETWDSVNVLSYMALVDQKFGREILPDDIAKAKTVGDLYRLAKGEAIFGS